MAGALRPRPHTRICPSHLDTAARLRRQRLDCSGTRRSPEFEREHVHLAVVEPSLPPTAYRPPPTAHRPPPTARPSPSGASNDVVLPVLGALCPPERHEPSLDAPMRYPHAVFPHLERPRYGSAAPAGHRQTTRVRQGQLQAVQRIVVAIEGARPPVQAHGVALPPRLQLDVEAARTRRRDAQACRGGLVVEVRPALEPASGPRDQRSCRAPSGSFEEQAVRLVVGFGQEGIAEADRGRRGTRPGRRRAPRRPPARGRSPPRGCDSGTG